MANNIAFQATGPTHKITASNTAANTITITANTPSNQYLFVNHNANKPVYVRISATALNAAVPGDTAEYGIPIPPNTMRVFTGPQCGVNTSSYISAIADSDSPDVYVTPGEGL